MSILVKANELNAKKLKSLLTANDVKVLRARQSKNGVLLTVKDTDTAKCSVLLNSLNIFTHPKLKNGLFAGTRGYTDYGTVFKWIEPNI